jgi:hypothetical protein
VQVPSQQLAVSVPHAYLAKYLALGSLLALTAVQGITAPLELLALSALVVRPHLLVHQSALIAQLAPTPHWAPPAPLAQAERLVLLAHPPAVIVQQAGTQQTTSLALTALQALFPPQVPQCALLVPQDHTPAQVKHLAVHVLLAESVPAGNLLALTALQDPTQLIAWCVSPAVMGALPVLEPPLAQLAVPEPTVQWGQPAAAALLGP